MNSLDVLKHLKGMRKASKTGYIHFYDVLNETGFKKDELDKILRDYATVGAIEILEYNDGIPAIFIVKV